LVDDNSLMTIGPMLQSSRVVLELGTIDLLYPFEICCLNS